MAAVSTASSSVLTSAEASSETSSTATDYSV